MSNNQDNLDEILFKDPGGGFKVVAGGQVKQWQKPAPVQPVKIEIIPPIRTEDLQKAADEILQEAGLESLDQFLKIRFKNLVISRLKEVRNRLETEEFLKRSIEVGGMSFDQATTDRVSKIIERRILTLSDELRNSASEKSELDLELQKLIRELQSSQIKKPQTNQPADIIFRSPPASSPKLPKAPAPKPKPQLKPEVQIKPSSKLEPPPPSAPPKITTKLTGPVEEIRDLTLIDFRRLASDPREATENIYNKILLLERESFTKKMQAILGWRQSEVFRIYREIGNKSMDEKKPAEQIISEHQATGHPTLTLAEFEAVMDLNQKLRF